MHISNLFSTRVVAKLPTRTGLEISGHARNFINNLMSIKNTAENKGHKVSSMYQQTEKYADKLAKSAEKGRINDTLKNEKKLQKYSNRLFYATGNVFNRDAINAATVDRINISSAVMKMKFN